MIDLFGFYLYDILENQTSHVLKKFQSKTMKIRKANERSILYEVSITFNAILKRFKMYTIEMNAVTCIYVFTFPTISIRRISEKFSPVAFD